ncbi:MAG: hydrogenase formation protein HypD [Labilithrix sp.]|nr:hydrogenase formation protein HypD [Labilithrix sp.]
MKFVDEFRDPTHAAALVREIGERVATLGRSPSRPLKIMEVCGGHTHSIFKYGIEQMLPPSIELVHGPGCPVCVLPVGRVDDAVKIAETPGVLFATYGDAIRVPGSRGSLLDAKAKGADVRTVYSPLDSLALARKNPDKRVVFFGLGFETTAPSTALTVLEAEASGVDNYFVFSNHITILPTIKAILDAPDLSIDGFIGPGHVTMVIGVAAYGFIADTYGKPFVIAGFEPLDVLQSLAMVVEQIARGEAKIENQYRRVVREGGNAVAQDAIERVFELRPHFEWRGLGTIEHSGLTFREPYARFDAEKAFAIRTVPVADPEQCQCGDVLKGVIKPWECKVFGTACTPAVPIGACMVSSEGACAAYYQYGRVSTSARAEARRELKVVR